VSGCDSFEGATFQNKARDPFLFSERELESHDVNKFGRTVRGSIGIEKIPEQEFLQLFFVEPSYGSEKLS
jgi:hypothetical protein